MYYWLLSEEVVFRLFYLMFHSTIYDINCYITFCYMVVFIQRAFQQPQSRYTLMLHVGLSLKPQNVLGTDNSVSEALSIENYQVLKANIDRIFRIVTMLTYSLIR